VKVNSVANVIERIIEENELLMPNLLSVQSTFSDLQIFHCNYRSERPLRNRVLGLRLKNREPRHPRKTVPPAHLMPLLPFDPSIAIIHAGSNLSQIRLILVISNLEDGK
jgi:hypothetical protein